MKTNKTNLTKIFALITLTLTFLAFWGLSAEAKVETLLTHKIGYGHYVTYEKNIVDETQPTLVFLPGVYRGLDSRDEVIEIAKEKGLNFISLHFSTQPESLEVLPKFEVPYFQYHNFTVANLAEEVTSLIDALHIVNPVIVGLSYTSVVTTELAKNPRFSLIIETAPMIRFDEANPDGSRLIDTWANYYRMYPVVGDIYARSLIRYSYTQHWRTAITQKYDESEYSQIRENIIKGYTEQSMIAHGFDYRTQNFETSVPRVFILGEDEIEQRAQNQQEAIGIYERTKKARAQVIIIKGAGHIVPVDQPVTYLNAIQKVLKKLNK